MKEFSEILTHAILQAAQTHGFRYTPQAAAAWAATGASYIGFVLCGFPVAQLRSIQYDTKEEYGPIIMDCKWYDLIKQLCLEQGKSITAFVPAGENRHREALITGELLIEALDFCREG